MPTLAPPAFDYPRLMARLGDDHDLFKELVAIFVEERLVWIAEIRRAIDAGNPADLHKIAHLVRGATGHFGAHHVTTLAASLETIGRTGDLAKAEPCFARLQTALEELHVALHDVAGNE